MDDDYKQFKARLRRKILDCLDLGKLRQTPKEEVLLLIRNLINAEEVPLSVAEKERLANEIPHEIWRTWKW